MTVAWTLLKSCCSWKRARNLFSLYRSEHQYQVSMIEVVVDIAYCCRLVMLIIGFEMTDVNVPAVKNVAMV